MDTVNDRDQSHVKNCDDNENNDREQDTKDFELKKTQLSMNRCAQDVTYP